MVAVVALALVAIMQASNGTLLGKGAETQQEYLTNTEPSLNTGTSSDETSQCEEVRNYMYNWCEGRDTMQDSKARDLLGCCGDWDTCDHSSSSCTSCGGTQCRGLCMPI